MQQKEIQKEQKIEIGDFTTCRMCCCWSILITSSVEIKWPPDKALAPPFEPFNGSITIICWDEAEWGTVDPTTAAGDGCDDSTEWEAAVAVPEEGGIVPIG